MTGRTGWSRASLRLRLTVLTAGLLCLTLSVGAVLLTTVLSRSRVAALDTVVRERVVTVAALTDDDRAGRQLLTRVTGRRRVAAEDREQREHQPQEENRDDQTAARSEVSPAHLQQQARVVDVLEHFGADRVSRPASVLGRRRLGLR